MSGSHDNAATRRISCGRCGTQFDCGLGGDCWCAAKTYRLPMPAEPAEDCLCPACLKAAAASESQ